MHSLPKHDLKPTVNNISTGSRNQSVSSTEIERNDVNNANKNTRKIKTAFSFSRFNKQLVSLKTPLRKLNSTI